LWSRDPDGEAEQVRVGGHGRLVEYHDGVAIESDVMVVESPQQ